MEKKERILKQIKDLERKYHMQVERISILKAYYVDTNENEKNVLGWDARKRYKYGDEMNRLYKKQVGNTLGSG